MKVNELKPGMNNVNLKGKLSVLKEPREIMTKFGTTVDLIEATFEDETGSIRLTLWGKQAEGLEEGQEVEIVGGFTKEFRDEIQLGIGKTGSVKAA